MIRIWKASAITLLALFTFAPMVSAQHRVIIVRRQPVVIVQRPLFWDPFWGPPYPYGYVAVPYTGDVKLKTDMKDASVYVDGGYAGKARKLKRFALPPGTHEIELRNSDGRTVFERRIEVIAGRTTDVEVRGLRG